MGVCNSMKPEGMKPPKEKGSSYAVTQIFAVHQGDDDRHVGLPAWYFSQRSLADAVAEGRGWYGGKAPISEIDVLVVEDAYFLLANKTPFDPAIINVGPENQEIIRRRAIAKLSALERKVLGLDAITEPS